MKKSLLVLILCLLPSAFSVAQMYSWQSHLAYGQSKHVEVTPTEIYVQAGGALYSINRKTEQITTYSKQDGLNGSTIAQIGYSEMNRCLMLMYEDGLIDFIYSDGSIVPMTDVAIKEMTSAKHANALVIDADTAFVAMPFGLMTINMAKRQVGETYYIGSKGDEVNVTGVTLTEDSMFVTDSKNLYWIARKDNAMDYSNWNSMQLPESTSCVGIGTCQDTVYMLVRRVLKCKAKENAGQDSIRYALQKNVRGEWKTIEDNQTFTRMIVHDNRLYIAQQGQGYWEITTSGLHYVATSDEVFDIAQSDCTWLAIGDKGVMRVKNDDSQLFFVDGPVVNIPYRLKIANQKVYVVPGGRWAEEMHRPANIMIYDIQQDTWTNITTKDIEQGTGGLGISDLMNVAVDPLDADHFFVTSFGNGLLECQGDKISNYFTSLNSPLVSAAGQGTPFELGYVRTDGAMFDEQGNLWLINCGVENAIHVATPADIADAHKTGIGKWFNMSLKTTDGNGLVLHTPQEMFTDNRYSNWKWIPYARYTPGLVLMDDNNTPFNSRDDKVVYRGSFKDQDGNVISVDAVYAVVQDKDDMLWIALGTGLITIPAKVDFRTSNACERIKIPRNDGTNLADYLLNTVRINAIAVDGANRKWFGTAGSGLYLMSEDGLETLEHFTTENSPLISDEILSLAIDPITGRVFIGTGKGLMSYQGDASAPFENYSSAYAYPNPVRPDYEGPITIAGLEDESIIHITDNAGNLVCETRSNGGTAIWDGKTADGRRVATGVYNVFCNAGGDHTIVKILVMH